jgi:hypothetical protein
VGAESDAFSSCGKETRFKALFFQYSQGFFQDILSGLLSWAPTNANYHSSSSKIHKRQCTLKLSLIEEQV